MKKLFAIALLASFTTLAAPLQWTCDWPEAKSQTFSLYQGETATFEPTFRVNGRTVTNATIEAVWYQTNGMGNAWWKLDGATFAPSNDVGAASYRFFVEAKASGNTIYRANGALRMLPSPGFTPNAIEPPIVALDFSTIEVANAPYYDKAETEAKIVELAPAPGNYTVVSNAAMSAKAAVEGILDDDEPTIVPYAANAENASYASFASSAGTADQAESANSLDGRDGSTILAQLDAAAQTNAQQEVAIAGKQDKLPYPTNAIPYAALSGKPTIPTVPTEVSAFTNDAGYLTSFTESDPTISSWAKAATKPSYNFSEIGSKPTTIAGYGITDAKINNGTITLGGSSITPLTGYTESDPTISSWAKAETKPTYTASEVGATTAEDVYRLITGTNVVLIITNYNSSAHAPSMKLQHLDPASGQYVTYWDETRRHGMTLTNAMDYADEAIQTRAAPRAWSGTTSGLGSEAPAGVTWISTPETVIAGGFEYEKVITSAGAVWVLSSNGLTTGATTNAFFRVAAADGTELFSIEKTDSYLIGVAPDDITTSGNTVTIPVNIVAGTHPYIRATTNLVNAVWVKEDENGFSCPWATVSWSGTTGAYVATVTCSQPQAFFYFEYTVEGVAKIKNTAKTEMTGGIIFNGTTYMPTVNGNKLEFVAQ